MSLKMIDYIVDQHYIDIDSGRLNRVKVNLFSHLFFIGFLLLFSSITMISEAAGHWSSSIPTYKPIDSEGCCSKNTNFALIFIWNELLFLFFLAH